MKSRNCDANPNAYFAFFPNHSEHAIGQYHIENLLYESHVVAVDRRQTGLPLYGHYQLPNNFSFLAEMHSAGYGT